MKFLDLVKKRQSVRAYVTKTVKREIIDCCIEAARLAPSACNSQPWRFIVIDNPELKNKVASCTKNKAIGINQFAEQAPVYVAVVTEHSSIAATIGSVLKNKAYNLIDTGIAVEHFCLQAAEEGLGTCIIGWFDEEKVKKLLKIQGNKRIPVVIAVGYAPKGYSLRKKVRKSIREIRKYNNF